MTYRPGLYHPMRRGMRPCRVTAINEQTVTWDDQGKPRVMPLSDFIVWLELGNVILLEPAR